MVVSSLDRSWPSPIVVLNPSQLRRLEAARHPSDDRVAIQYPLNGSQL
jgi:hypothetical protein